MGFSSSSSSSSSTFTRGSDKQRQSRMCRCENKLNCAECRRSLIWYARNNNSFAVRILSKSDFARFCSKNDFPIYESTNDRPLVPFPVAEIWIRINGPQEQKFSMDLCYLWFVMKLHETFKLATGKLCRARGTLKTANGFNGKCIAWTSWKMSFDNN